jgi:hypothetical protein
MILLFGSIRKFLDTTGNNSEIEERSWHDRIMEYRNGLTRSLISIIPKFQHPMSFYYSAKLFGG